MEDEFKIPENKPRKSSLDMSNELARTNGRFKVRKSVMNNKPNKISFDKIEEQVNEENAKSPFIQKIKTKAVDSNT